MSDSATRSIGNVGTGQVIERFNLPVAVGAIRFQQRRLQVKYLEQECWELTTEMKGTITASYKIEKDRLSVYRLELENGSNGQEVDERLIKESGVDRAMVYLANRKGLGLEASPALVDQRPWAKALFVMPPQPVALRTDDKPRVYFV